MESEPVVANTHPVAAKLCCTMESAVVIAAVESVAPPWLTSVAP